VLCCAALLFVLGLFRKAEPGFAPSARRPAPGSESPQVVQREDEPIEIRSSLAARALAGFGIGSLLYSVLVYGLIVSWADAAHSRSGLGAWLVRDAAVAVLAVGALIIAKRRSDPQLPSYATWLMGMGIAWWLLGFVDMHLLGLFELDGGMPADLLFHGSGVVLVAAGAIAFGRSLSRGLPLVRTLEGVRP
jgi:hypothetical protein